MQILAASRVRPSLRLGLCRIVHTASASSNSTILAMQTRACRKSMIEWRFCFACVLFPRSSTSPLAERSSVAPYNVFAACFSCRLFSSLVALMRAAVDDLFWARALSSSLTAEKYTTHTFLPLMSMLSDLGVEPQHFLNIDACCRGYLCSSDSNSRSCFEHLIPFVHKRRSSGTSMFVCLPGTHVTILPQTVYLDKFISSFCERNLELQVEAEPYCTRLPSSVMLSLVTACHAKF